MAKLSEAAREHDTALGLAAEDARSYELWKQSVYGTGSGSPGGGNKYMPSASASSGNKYLSG